MSTGGADGTPFSYEGPPECLAVVRQALEWVIHPCSGQPLAQEGRVRSVRIGDGLAVVELALPPGGVTQVVVEDVEAELFDHLQGSCRIEVRLVPPPPPVLAWARGAEPQAASDAQAIGCARSG